MIRPLALLSFAALFTAMPAQAAGTVEVRYVEPEKFTDIGLGSVERDHTLRDMTAVLQALGAKLPDGQTLTLEITDINLAGERRPGRQGDVRVLGGTADWPEVQLRYTLLAGTTTLKSGQAKVYDLSYLQGASFVDKVGTNLPYERHMLRKWFAETFGTAP